MGPLPPLPVRGLFILAMIGLAACAISVIGGLGFLIWFIVNHVQIV